jgi:hypothetical protein
MSILLVYPPVAKLSEPPAGIARLAGTLRSNGVTCKTVDLNLECMLELLDESSHLTTGDTWSRRAQRKCGAHLADLRTQEIYGQPSRYRQAVNDLNRLLSQMAAGSSSDISLANYSDSSRSPLQSENLLNAAESFNDNPFFPSFSKRVDELLASETPQVVGLSISYLSQALTGFAILGYLRQRYPGIRRVAGGGLITSWMNNPGWEEPFAGLIDTCIKGPGEQELLQLCGQERSPEWGEPDYDDFAAGLYLSPGFILPYAASDGCYWKKCSFCPDKAEDTPFIQITPERVTTQIRSMVEKYQPTLLHLLDNAIPPIIQKNLIEHPPGVPWYGFSRFERELEEPAFCRKLRKSGCILLKLGLESGSVQVLEQMNKGIRLDRVSRILANLRSAGISTYVYLLFGTPSERLAEARQTLELVKARHREIAFLNLAIFNMPVCSPEAEHVPDRFSDGDLSLYCDFEHPLGWDRRAIRTFLDKEFRKDALVNEIVQRDPPFFTSNHAPLFCLHGNPVIDSP